MTSILTRLRPRIEALLARADLAIVRRSNYEHWLGEEAPSYDPLPCPPSATAELRADNPRLTELAERYHSHPAAAHSVWSGGFVATQVNLKYFRGDNAYVWQRRLNMQRVNYALTTFYLQRHDPLRLLERLGEDQLFGALTHDIDGLLVSRDLLDSITELNFLEEEMGISSLPAPTVLDIGAGYGRLAHRFTTALAGTYLCTDGVALSTFLCDYYLRFRNAVGAEAVPVDEISTQLQGRKVDLAINVHSFSECPISAIEWWLNLLASNDVGYLMIVPNGDGLLSTEGSGDHVDFLPSIESRGFELVTRRPKYAHSQVVQQYGIYPGTHFLFRRK